MSFAWIQWSSEGGLMHLLPPAAALVAGAATSLHCVGMCGPLSCALLQGKDSTRRLWPSQGLYHLGRLLSYSALGFWAGLLGSRFVGLLGGDALRLFPWLMVGVFLALGLGVDAWVTRWQARRGWGRSLLQRAYRASGPKRGFALGIATPLIPCGPLYLMLWATVASGSATGGALAMAGFAIGTMPVLFAAQQGWAWFSARSRPTVLAYWRRGLCLAAAGVVLVRVFVDTDLAALSGGGGLCH